MTAQPRHDPSRLSGLYVILDQRAARGRDLDDVLAVACAAGARLFQYRNKEAPMVEAYREAARLRRRAADAGALFLVNDRCDLAIAVDADGVHLGQADLPLQRARAVLGSEKLIGLSTHSVAQVQEAVREGADYVAFGPVFETVTKPDRDPLVGVAGLAQIRAMTTRPLFAIGGISLENVDAVMAAGADGVAVISAVLSAPDIGAAVTAFLARLRR
ncbi:thiamine phosphate synthase [Nitrospira sp. Kam-Ns4a]